MTPEYLESILSLYVTLNAFRPLITGIIGQWFGSSMSFPAQLENIPII